MKTVLLISAMVAVFLRPSWTQSHAGRFHHPYIMRYIMQMCSFADCAADEVCDLYMEPCVRNCQSYISCYRSGTGTPYKFGNCPAPLNVRSRGIQCAWDWSCPGTQLCCHGIQGSRCMPRLSPPIP